MDSLNSKFYKTYFPEEIYKGIEFIIKIDFNIPTNEDYVYNSDEFQYIILNDSFDENYMHFSNKKTDTIISLKENQFIFPYKFRRLGKQNFRAIIELHLFGKEKDSKEVKIKRLLINEEINVLDTDAPLIDI